MEDLRGQVPPAIRERGSGAPLFPTGASSVRPLGGESGAIGIGAAALRDYALALNVGLAANGIHAAHPAIAVCIGTQPGTEPAAIAERYWQPYMKRDESEIIYALPGGTW
ncbi:hypothetical protein ACGF3G_46395 [Streptomyces sp. NPDC048179]|uniref:hypothetical protein n=1 Tax=Streptomyces sp. NPDC048179 TaxID=3365506 RepID=UPI003717F7D5